MATGGLRTDTATGDERLRFGTEPFYASIGRAFLAMCAFIPVLWGIEGLDTLFGGALDRAGGIAPRNLTGLDGIVFAPLLHASFTHVLANSVPLLLLGTFVLAGHTKRFFLITAFIAVVSGLTVWVFGPSNSITVGASGVIFGYLGYLLLRGLVERRWWSLGISLLMGLLFGWQLSGILPGEEHVSWQGHLGGFLAGLVAAILFRQPRARRPKPAGTGSTTGLGGSSPTLTLPGVDGLGLGKTGSDRTVEMPGGTSP
ncbi:rhomboid family intramembrane serine protease [Actinocatenispora sera]|uniref:rhomboid family intramembrane serine protease n=1 Tax=Actinocatenispora sera TaxID=390989 RepID=UPI0033E6DAE0